MGKSSVIGKMTERLSTILESISAIIRQLKEYEEKYRIPTGEFVRKWRNGEIKEPKDPDTLTDFLNWDGLYEVLMRRIAELKNCVK